MLRRFAYFSFAALLMTLPACGDDDAPPPDADGRVIDAGADADTASPDANAPDAGTPDAGAPDATPQALIVAPTEIALTEGGSAGSFTVQLAVDPLTELDVTVASSDPGAVTVSPGAVTFDSASFGTPKNIQVTPADDFDTDDESVVLTISAAGVPSVTVEVTVTDDDVLVMAVDPAAMTIVEGGTGLASVVLATVPTEDVVMTVASSDPLAASVAPMSITFTPANWSTPRLLTITGEIDDDVDDEAVTISLSAVGLATRTIAVTVTDDDVPNISVEPGTVTLLEGGPAGSVEVTLTQPPDADVVVDVSSSDPGAAIATPASLTFGPGDYDTPQTVTITPVDDIDLDDESLTVDFQSVGLTTRSATVSVTDDDAQGIIVSATTLEVAEGGTATLTVALAADPGGAVAVNVATSDSGAATAAPTTLDFDSGDYSTPRVLTITGVQDLDLLDESVSLTLTGPDSTAETVTVTVVDDDVQVIRAVPDALVVQEGSTGTVGVSLRFKPAADVTVDLASADTAVATVSSATLSFTPANFATPQFVTVTGPDDADVVDDNTTVTLSAAGITSTAVSISVVDTDLQTIVAAPSSLAVTEGGSSATFDVDLSQSPAGDLLVTVQNPDPGALTVSPATLTFGPGDYSVPQTVTVSAVDDLDPRDESVEVSLVAPGVLPTAVAVNVTDPDTQALVVTPLSTSVVEEGTPASIAVRLAYEPAGPTAVSIASMDPASVAVSTNALTFTPSNYAVPQNFEVTGVSDADVLDEVGVVVEVSASGLSPVQVAVTVADDDEQAIVVSKTALVLGEHGPNATFEVRLAHRPSSTTVLELVHDLPGKIAASPALFSFTSASYSTPKIITISGVDDLDVADESGTITVRDTSLLLTPKDLAVTVNDDDLQALIVQPDPLEVAENDSAVLSVRLAFQPNDEVTVELDSDDAVRLSFSGITLPLVFTPADFSSPRLVTVAAAADGDAVNEVRTIWATPTVTPSDAPIAVEATTVRIIDDDAPQIVLAPSALTLVESTGGGAGGTVGVSLSEDPGTDVVVAIASDDPTRVATGASSLSFSGSCTGAGCWDTPQPVEVFALADLDLSNHAVAVRFTAPVASDRILTVNVTDDDQQAIVAVPSALTGSNAVAEEGTRSINVRLAFAPVAPVTVTGVSADASVAVVTSPPRVFDAGNWNIPQSIVVRGTTDQNLDDASTRVDIDANPPGPARENPALVFVPVDVVDNDLQSIIVDTGPRSGACDLEAPSCPDGYDCLNTGDGQGTCFFRIGLQEGGPSYSFTMRLEFPPILRAPDNGVEDVWLGALGRVEVEPEPFVTFNRSNYAEPITVVVKALEEVSAAPLDDSDSEGSIELASGAVYPALEFVPLTVTDDERTIIASADYSAAMSDGTAETKRQNLRWSGATLAVNGRNPGGDMVGVVDTRELGGASAPMIVGVSPTADGVASEYDEVDFGVFSADGADRIVFSRLDRDLSTAFVDRAVVVSSAAAEFWSARDTVGDLGYGLIYRRTAVAPGLYFTTVDPSDGGASSPIQLTSSGGVLHEMPNLHRLPIGFGGNAWLALYTAGTELRCVTLNEDGSGAADVAIASVPAATYVSSVHNGTEVIAVYATSEGLFSLAIDDTCAVSAIPRRLRGPATYAHTPVIAFNGVEHAVAFDTAGTPNESGVMRLDLDGRLIDELWPLETGDRPSVEWLGDRWALRTSDPVNLVVGSFQTDCANGVLDGDEDDVDCGGSCPRRCARLWASDGQQGYAGNLYEIDPVTGAATTIGALPEAISALAFNPLDGYLYGTSSLQGTDVWQIDPATGAGTVVGSIASVPFVWSTMNDWDFLPDGALIGSRQHECSMHEIDIETGTGISVAAITGCFRDGIAADGDGRVYYLDKCGASLVEYDSATYASSVGPTVSCPPAVERNFHAAAWSDGAIYALRYDRPNSGIVQNEIVRINPKTGAASVIATDLPDGLQAIAGTK